MSQLANTIKEVSKNYKVYDKWEQNQADKMAKKDYIVKNIGVPKDKLELTKQRAQTVVRATEIMDTRSENNCENVEQVVGMLSSAILFPLAFAQIPAEKYLNKYLNKKSNKQLAEAEKKLAEATSPERKKELLNKIKELTEGIKNNSKKASKYTFWGILGATIALTFGTILWGNAQQKQASRIGRFQAKQEELKGLENFITYTPEQLNEAMEIAKTIPDKKERNSFSQALHEMKEMQRDRGAYKRWAKQKDPKELEKLKNRTVSPEELTKAKEDKELITNIVSEVNIKAEEFSENLENAYDTVGTLSWIAAVPLGFGINSLISKFSKMTPAKSKIISAAVASLTALGISIAGTFEQKKASRIGRYHARKDLLNNPHKLIAFTDKEMAQASHVKAPKQKKSFFQKIGESFSFLKNYYKQKSEYKKYKKTTQKSNEKLQEALKQVKATNAQKAEAKALQTNVFRAFDEVDEMSQRYSEDIEATTEIAKTTATNLFQLAWMGATALLGIGIYKGKVSLVKPLKWVRNGVLSKESSIGKSIDKLYESLFKQDKNTRQEFQKAFLRGKNGLEKFFGDAKYPEIKTALSELGNEFGKITADGVIKLTQTNSKKTANQVYMEILNEHTKQTPIAKWGRNLFIEGCKLKAITKSKSMGMEIPKELQKEFGLNFNYKNYKTLINTGIVGGIPILVPLFAVPYIFNAWLTDIQKKAGKIGVMKAMNNLDDPKIFANTNS